MDKHRLSLIVIAVLAVGILLGGLLIGIQPQLTRMNTANAQAETITATNDIQEKRNRALAADNANLDAYKGDLEKEGEQIPTTRSQQELINQIDAAASASGVKVRNLSFEAAAAYEPPAGMKLTAPSGSTLVAVPVSLSADGPRAKLETFLDKLQQSRRIVTISSSQFTSGESDSITLAGTTWVLLPS